MEEIKKKRSAKGGTVTRRINELNNALKTEVEETDLNEMISKLKVATENLGEIQDAMVSEIDGNDEALLQEAEQWYYGYIERANVVLRSARRSMKPKDLPMPGCMPVAHSNVRIKKLEVPKFDSSHKTYYKWKATFERYTSDLDAEIKYDYLLSCTQGMANEYVANKSNYREAILKLDEVFGNVHEIIRILLDEIRSIPPVKDLDFRAFESFSFQVNNFQDRLIEMGLKNEVENKYVLNELERKLSHNDMHKWLDSLKDRKVQSLAKWLEKEVRVRRIILGAPQQINSNYKLAPVTGNRSSYITDYPSKGRRNIPPYVMNPLGQNLSSNLCVLCNTEHTQITDCQILPLLPLNEKWNFVKGNSLCFICLDAGHQRTSCSSSKCEICQGPHHKLLHNPRRLPQTAVNNDSHVAKLPASSEFPMYNNNSVALPEDRSNYDSTSSNPIERSNTYLRDVTPTRCFLPVVRSTLQNGDRKYNAMTLLDSGSEINVISTRCCEKLKLSGAPITISITGAGGVMKKRNTKLVEVSILDMYGSLTQIECIVMNEVCGRVLSIGKEIIDSVKQRFKVDLDNLITNEGKIDILIGLTSPQLHKQLSMSGYPNQFHIVETLFGPCLMGPVPKGENGNYEAGAVSSNVVNIERGDEDNEKFLKYLEAELAGINKECDCQTKTDDELRFEEAMRSSWIISDDGRFEIQLPWKINPEKLANNREQAVYRDIKLRKQLGKNEETMKMFRDQINEMIEGDILRKVDADYPKRYLPLLAVLNLDRESTKVRVCLDSKTKFQGFSINDALLKGKMEMLDIFQAITRFRSGEYAIMGDVKKMFWQIKLSNDDQRYHGVIWEGNTFLFTRVCFGDLNSPPIAECSMRKVAASGRNEYPYAYDALINKRYMDDIIDASSKPEVIIRKRDEIGELLGRYGFEIKKWFSNNSDLGVVNDDQKVLGMRWHMRKDELSVAISKSTRTDPKHFTKREVLSRIAAIWDPLGVCSGFVLKGRLIFQSIVRLKLKWDEPILDADLQKKWNSWKEQHSSCEDVIIGRSILPPDPKKFNPTCQLVGFSDGSSNAYGCVLYARWTNTNGSEIDVKFLGAKGKVGPIGGNTVPRQELSGALILSRLTNSMIKALEHTELEHAVKEVKLFTDSTTVLKWINSEAIRYKPYVKNKVIEIQDLLPASSWSYLPSQENRAADLISKGCNVSELDVILHGPRILREPSMNWDKVKVTVAQEENADTEELGCHVILNTEQKDVKNDIVVEQLHDSVVNEELMKKEVGGAKRSKEEKSTAEVKIEEDVIDVSKYKSFKKLKRVTAYILRWKNRVEANSPRERGTIPPLTEQELQKLKTFG